MRRTWRKMLAGSAVATLIVGVGVVGLPAVVAVAAPAPPKLDGISFLPAVQSLESTTHKLLSVGLGASKSTQSDSTFSGANVSVSRKGVPESHNWNFTLTAGSIAYNPATGRGFVHSATQLKPFGKIALTLRAIGKSHTTTCGTYKTITQRVSARGVFIFDTHSTGKGRWGKVGHNAARTFTGRSEVIYETGEFQSCGPPFIYPCSADVGWSAFTSGAGINEVSFDGSISTVGKKTVRMLFVVRTAGLKAPKGASRTDQMDIRDSRMTFAVASKKATIRLGATGPITGSATLISPTAGTKSTPFSCGKTPKRTQNETSWQAPYKNGKSPLTVHEQIEGPFRLPNISLASHESEVTQSTVS
jgi:hypothetical protein